MVEVNPVQLYNNVVEEQLCLKLIKIVNLLATKKLGLGQKDFKNKKQRNVYGYSLNLQNENDLKIVNLVSTQIYQCLLDYKKKFAELVLNDVSQVDLLKYEKGGHYVKHIDQDHAMNRILSFIINLNEGYEGGEVCFYNPQTSKPLRPIPLEVGDILFFPSNFLYPHAILPIKHRTRFSIVGWLN
tara:strand:- start:3542 stop:4096 length:555 start_codon:yes stop_codon:yes gene_type:complete